MQPYIALGLFPADKHLHIAFCANSTKITSLFLGRCAKNGAGMTGFELFEEVSSNNTLVANGDVTCISVDYGREYTVIFAWKQGAWILDFYGEAVEKTNFSTISTGFSTGVFHCEKPRNIHPGFT